MNYNESQHFDPRPKRRKSKDNPYTLFSKGMWNGSPQYYVSFQTTEGYRVCLEIEREVFKAMDRFELSFLAMQC